MNKPGQGAIEYARECVEGLSWQQAKATIQRLLTSPPEDPRIKRCNGCGYLFRDKTRPGNAKVCGDSCKTIVKSKQKQVQRARKATIKTNKPIKYVYWLEYPYWVPERAMFSSVGSYERPFDSEKLGQIVAARERYNRMGGRRKTRKSVAI